MARQSIYQRVVALLKTIMEIGPQQIFETALKWLGRDASPADIASDEFGCAETVTNILQQAGCDIPILVSTTKLNALLKGSERWKLVLPDRIDAGHVIISPTGEGGRNGIKNGHTGIIMEKGNIASSDSATGKFLQNYTLSTWNNRYVKLGGYPVYVYERIVKPVAPPPTPPANLPPVEREKWITIMRLIEALIKLRKAIFGQ